MLATRRSHVCPSAPPTHAIRPRALLPILGVLLLDGAPARARPAALPRRRHPSGHGRQRRDRVHRHRTRALHGPHHRRASRTWSGRTGSMILARLEGGPLATTGVIAGMSGSPVYIDGHLVGAVAYSLGQFTKEPIAGITPIGEMIDARVAGRRPSASRPRPGPVRLPVDEAVAGRRPAAAACRGRPVRRPALRRPCVSCGVAGTAAAALRRIATPLALERVFRDAGAAARRRA